MIIGKKTRPAVVFYTKPMLRISFPVRCPGNGTLPRSIRRHPYSVIFIKADGDYLAPEFLKENITGLANARFVLVNGAGHNMWLEQPGKFREEMSKAIKE
ncbi:MAG: alpha/beta hydrolase [Bacteroidota bacterium]